MPSVRFVRRYLPLLVLVLLAGGAWRAADQADVDDERIESILYERDLATPVLSARRIPRTLQAPVADDAIRPAFDTVISGSPPNTCLEVTANGRLLTAQNAKLPLVPASNEKMPTTFSALTLFGPDKTFTTELRRVGAVNAGVLEGDLYLVGGGDPFLSTDDWWAQYDTQDGRANTRLEVLADQVAAAGITAVSGAVFGDETLFDAERYGPWAARLIDTRQSGPLSALSVNEGYVSWPEVYTGSFRPRVPTDNPPAHAAEVFARLLGERGIAIAPGGAATVPAESELVGQVVSPPLSKIAAHINSYSNNFGAEVLLKHIGLAQLGVGSTSAGAQAMTTLLADRGFTMDGVVLYDGSGLSEETRLTCGLLTALLTDAGIGSAFGQGLSIGGVRGSLIGRHVATAATGNVFAKTGTLNDVSALSGYVASSTDPATTLTFAYIVNGELAGQDERIRGLQEPFVEQLALYPAGGTIEQLSPFAPLVNPQPEVAAGAEPTPTDPASNESD